MSTDLNICHVWIVNNSGTQKWQNNRHLRGRFTEPAKSSVMDEVNDFLLPLICSKNIDSVPPCMSYYLMLGVEVTLLFGHITTLLMARTCLIGQLEYRIFNSEILQIIWKGVLYKTTKPALQNTRLQSVWLRQAVELPSVQAGATRARVHFLKNRWLLWVAELFSYSWMALAKCTWKCVMCNVQCCYQMVLLVELKPFLHVTDSRFVLVFGGVFLFPDIFDRQTWKRSARSVKQSNVARHLLCHATQKKDIVLKSIFNQPVLTWNHPIDSLLTEFCVVGNAG